MAVRSNFTVQYLMIMRDCSQANDNDEISMCGYDIVRKDRNRNGGGVALYITNVIDYYYYYFYYLNIYLSTVAFQLPVFQRAVV